MLPAGGGRRVVAQEDSPLAPITSFDKESIVSETKMNSPSSDTYDEMQLDPFTHAYIVCALWSSTDESTPSGGKPLDDHYDATNIAPEALEEIKTDCRVFQQAHADLLAQAYALYAVTDGSSPEEYAGYDFWLTRN